MMLRSDNLRSAEMEGREVTRICRWTLWRIGGKLVWKHDREWIEPAKFERLTAAASHADYVRQRRRRGLD